MLSLRIQAYEKTGFGFVRHGYIWNLKACSEDCGFVEIRINVQKNLENSHRESMKVKAIFAKYKLS